MCRIHPMYSRRFLAILLIAKNGLLPLLVLGLGLGLAEPSLLKPQKSFICISRRVSVPITHYLSFFRVPFSPNDSSRKPTTYGNGTYRSANFFPTFSSQLFNLPQHTVNVKRKRSQQRIISMAGVQSRLSTGSRSGSALTLNFRQLLTK